MVFVDTSALIALLDEDDARHGQAALTFRWLALTADLVTHNYVHVEALAVATRRLGAPAAERLIDALFPVMRTVWVDEALHGAALAAHRAPGGTASVVDHVSFLLMRQEGIDVAFAFDADFAAQGFRLATAPREDVSPRRLSEVVDAYGEGRPAPSELVSVSEIAARAGRPVNTIQSWRRRHRDFPAPAAQLAAGPIWHWPAVADWIARRSSGRTAAARRPTPPASSRPRVPAHA